MANGDQVAEDQLRVGAAVRIDVGEDYVEGDRVAVDVEITAMRTGKQLARGRELRGAGVAAI